MDIKVRHANPEYGNESYVIRFDDGPSHQYTPCLLVDSGSGVDIDQILDDNEYLVGILLTHAHSDHYATLADNLQDGADIYTAPDTATILDTVLTNHDEYTSSEVAAVMDAVTPVSDWTTLVNGVRLAPVPAGHAPGAAGFLLQFEDDGEWRTMLATGDFTFNDVAGYPGFTTALPADVEALFLTGTTTPDHTETMTDALSQAVELASAGSRVLLSTTGLSAVTAAYRLGHLADELDANYSVTIMGQAAKLYDDLGYEAEGVPNVRTVAEFSDPDPHFREGMIAIAGPQVPTEGASERLFNCIRDDPGAALIQLTNGAASPVTSASCTVADYTHIAHPSEDAVDRLVDTLAPAEVFVTHQTGQNAARYRDKYTSYVWAGDTTNWHHLYDSTGWRAPPWMTTNGKSYVRGAPQTLTLTDGGVANGPSPTRDGTVDLAAEGLDIDAFPTISLSQATTQPPADTASGGDGTATGTTASQTTESRRTAVIAGGAGETEAGDTMTDETTPTESATVRVVDAGDDVTLLRVQGDVPDSVADAAHGDELGVQFVSDT